MIQTRGSHSTPGSLLPGRADTPGCVDCGWMPRPGELWPTEGPRAVRWMETLLICAEGDWFGKPLRLRPDQKRFVWKWYEFCPACGYWHYDQALRGAATGDGKTTFVAGLECLEMFGPPQIAPVSPNIINAAASFEQADLLFSIAGVMLGGRDQAVKEAPLCGYAEVYDTEIRYADGRPGIMKRVAAVAGTNEGGLPSLFVGDELHEWGEVGSTKARVHMVIGKSTKKRRMICRLPDGREVTRGPGRVLNISTAGFDVEHSLLGAMYLNGKKAEYDPGVAPRLLFDWHEGEDGDFSDPAHRRRAVRAASEAAGVLWDVEARVREWDKPEVEHHEWIRYYANKWVPVSQDSWLRDHPGAWAACKGTWTIAGHEPAVLAVDMALKRDSVSVRELAQLDDGRVATVNRTWYPADGKIDHLQVWEYIKGRAGELGRRYRGLVYDPRFFELPARLLEEDGFLVIEFDQSPSNMAPACGMAFDMIINRQIVHSGDPDEARQVNAAVKREQERGFTLSKGRSRIHIDAAVTLCMGVDALARLAKPVNWANTVW
jgi:phage terminase large subunit-like protein